MSTSYGYPLFSNTKTFDSIKEKEDTFILPPLIFLNLNPSPGKQQTLLSPMMVPEGIL